MSELSTQAQAVLAAAINDNTDIINNYSCDWIQGYSRQIAAALRAAAIDPSEIDLPLSKVVEWEKIEGVCASYYAAAKWGYEQALVHINDLAKELENQ